MIHAVPRNWADAGFSKAVTSIWTTKGEVNRSSKETIHITLGVNTVPRKRLCFLIQIDAGETGLEKSGIWGCSRKGLSTIDRLGKHHFLHESSSRYEGQSLELPSWHEHGPWRNVPCIWNMHKEIKEWWQAWLKFIQKKILRFRKWKGRRDEISGEKFPTNPCDYKLQWLQPNQAPVLEWLPHTCINSGFEQRVSNSFVKLSA